MTRRSQIHADNDAIERLRTGTTTWEDRHDEVLSGLLALTRNADQLAPVRLISPKPPRRHRPALAGLATTAIAGAAFAFAALAGGTAAPAPTVTQSTQAAAVSRMLATVRADLSRAQTAPAASRSALLVQASRTLAVAERRTQLVPSSTERTDLTTSSAQLTTQLLHPQHPLPAPEATPTATTAETPVPRLASTPPGRPLHQGPTGPGSTAPATATTQPQGHGSGHGGQRQNRNQGESGRSERQNQRN